MTSADVEEFVANFRRIHPSGTKSIVVMRYLDESNVRYLVFKKNEAKISGIDIIFDNVDQKMWSKIVVRVIVTFDDDEGLVGVEKREQRYSL